MNLTINGVPVKASAGDTFQKLIGACGSEPAGFRDLPLAVKAGGMLISLNHIPAKKPTPDGPDRVFYRALETAQGNVTTVSVTDKAGYDLYVRSVIFVLLTAFHRLFPEAHIHWDYAVRGAEFFSVSPEELLTKENVKAIKAECRKIVSENVPLIRERLYIDDAADLFRKAGYEDAVRLLSWRILPYFDLYRIGDYADYLYSVLAPSTGCLTVFDIVPAGGKLILLPPDPAEPEKPLPLVKSKKLSAAFRKNADWNRLMHCMTISDLNEFTENGSIRDLIRVNEALHEKDYAAIADNVLKSGARAILLAGPSSSGKTTSANRICTQLRVLGKTPFPISLDDYYKDRDKCLPGPDGKIDLEHIDCLDTARFREDLSALVSGREVRLPRFDFKTQKSIPDGGKLLRPDKDTIYVIEGLHGLNPQMLPDTIDRSSVFKVYVSALCTLNFDSHNRIPSTEMRLLRRMVRDYQTRNSSVIDTLSMWDSVHRGEDRWIFPFQEEADAVFNSTLVYEPAVLKKYIYPLLMNVHADSPYYDQVRSIVKFLNYILEANVEDEIPPTSVLREFIGGNTFYR